MISQRKRDRRVGLLISRSEYSGERSAFGLGIATFGSEASCVHRHEGFLVRTDKRGDHVDGRAGLDVEVSAVRAAPGMIGRLLRHMDDGNVLACSIDEPQPAGTGDPDVASFIALHAIGYTFCHDTVSNAVFEEPPVREAAILMYVVDIDQGSYGVVDVQQGFIR
jgi:hypothetical protein